jgi:hypothetical protein
MSKLYYLASPYSHKDPKVRQRRHDQVLEVAAFMFGKGVFVWAPIVYTHNIATEGSLELGYSGWKRFDRMMISKCDALLVLQLEGWRESVGVRDEVEYAKALGMEVGYVPCDGLEEWFERMKGVVAW